MSLEKRQSQGNHVYIKFKSLDIHLEKGLWLWMQNYYFSPEKARKRLLLWRGACSSCVACVSAFLLGVCAQPCPTLYESMNCGL